jgi:hypothetical protein|tara:strand:+ start:135 stop:317 length:183 start_codon:yes stop_codon:yes gene_type:complete
MNLIKKIYQDFQRASENKEFYDRCQHMFKGHYAQSNAVLEHMELDYLPKSLRNIITKIIS